MFQRTEYTTSGTPAYFMSKNDGPGSYKYLNNNGKTLLKTT